MSSGHVSLRGMHTVRQGRCPPFGRTANRRWYNVCRHYTMSIRHVSLRGVHTIRRGIFSPSSRKQIGAGIMSVDFILCRSTGFLRAPRKLRQSWENQRFSQLALLAAESGKGKCWK